MSIGEIDNTVRILKSFVRLESFNPWMDSHEKDKLEWMLVQSKRTTVGDKNNVRKYYEIIK